MRYTTCSQWIAMAAVCVLLLGCGGGGSSADATSAPDGRETDQKLTVAVIPKATGGEFWETVEQGAREAAKDLGVEIKWEGPLAETEIAEQNKIIENMISLRVDGMALAPLNNRAMRKPVENVVEAGIPVVIFDSGIDGDAHVSYVATDNEAGGRLAAEQLAEMLGDKDRVFVLRYIQGTASTEQRAKGFIEAIKATGKNVLGDPYTDDATVTGAKKTATNSLEGFVKNGKLELDGIFVTNLYSTLGMVGALDDLRQSGVNVDVVFIGFDTSPKLIDELKSGDLDALISQRPHKMGYLAVETLVKHLRGEPIEPLVDTGVEFVTLERLENEPAIRELVGAK